MSEQEAIRPTVERVLKEIQAKEQTNGINGKLNVGLSGVTFLVVGYLSTQLDSIRTAATDDRGAINEVRIDIATLRTEFQSEVRQIHQQLERLQDNREGR